MFRTRIASVRVQADMATWQMTRLDFLEIVLDQVGTDVVAWLRSYTNEWRPPASARGSSVLHRVRDKKGGRSVRMVRAPGSGSQGKRRAHPGHWADITGDLKAKYGYRVKRTRNSVRLEIFNESEHAVYVEAMDGFFVVKGMADAQGPIDQRLRAVLRQIAPNWKVM